MSPVGLFKFGLIPSSVSAPVSTFNIAELFTLQPKSVWYDPSDFSTLFQDSAGTVPVSALEQPVALMRDKSGNGVHARQTQSVFSRPVVSARVNLLNKTEQFSSTYWTKTNVTVEDNNIASPIGTTTACKLTETNTLGSHYVITKDVFLVDKSARTWSISVKPGTARYLTISHGEQPTTDNTVIFDTLTNTYTHTGIARYILNTINIQKQGNGWYRVGFSSDNDVITYDNMLIGISSGPNFADTVYTGTGKYLYIWGADLRSTNQATGILPAYQQVTSSTNYGIFGFPVYLRFDGIDDWLESNSTNVFAGTDKMTTFAGIRKYGDNIDSVICELSDNSWNNNGTFGMFASLEGQLSKVFVSLRGNTQVRRYHTIGAPVTFLQTAIMDIGQNTRETELTLRVNKVTPVIGNTDYINAGTGTFGTYPIFIGKRGGVDLSFRGGLYGLLLTQGILTTQNMSSIESEMNKKTKAF